MLLNRIEKALMNNPARQALQEHFEARWLHQMGGPIPGGRALEVGCGRGVGVELILRKFGASQVDAFDLDNHMVELARERLKNFTDRVRLWVGDASSIEAPDNTYDAVFDFGILHHVPHWGDAVREIHRVLKPGGRFYGEEVLRAFILNPVVRRLLEHPLEDRFDHQELQTSLVEVGFRLVDHRQLGRSFGWYVADKLRA